MTTNKQNKEFAEMLMTGYPLDEAISWINTNLNPEEVFDAAVLESWAKDHGMDFAADSE